MSSTKLSDVEIQRKYYTETAQRYDEMHVCDTDKEHDFALSFLVSMLDYLDVKSVLDIGSGTGRTLRRLKKDRPNIRVVGIEPVKELREIAYQQGILETELVYGDALSLKYDDNEFDMVCEFGVLHHIKTPSLVVSEMLRVSNKAIFLSDSNNFGQGSLLGRSIKQLINLVGLWPVANFIKTKGKGYSISDGDGLGYSYSVFDNYRQIRRRCRSVHVLNTRGGHINPYRTASHVALLALR